jgi:hypothetical protein
MVELLLSHTLMRMLHCTSHYCSFTSYMYKHTDAEWRLAYCTYRPRFSGASLHGKSPIEAIVAAGNDHAAALVIANFVAAWGESCPLDTSISCYSKLDCLAGEQLLYLLKKFPELYSDLLLKQVKLVPSGESCTFKGKRKDLWVHTSHNKWCSELWQLKAGSSASATKGTAARRASLLSNCATPAKRASLTGVGTAAKRASVDMITASTGAAVAATSVRNAAGKLPAIALTSSAAAQCLRTKENDVFASGWFVESVRKCYYAATAGVLALWTALGATGAAHKVHVTPLVLPVRGLATTELLQTAVRVAHARNSAEVFGSDVVAATVQLHWDFYGNREHVFSLTVYAVLLTLFVLLTVWFDDLVGSGDAHLVRFGWALQIVKCVITTYFVYEEIMEAWDGGMQQWVSDFWNISK